jgi:streptogramin lyase
MPFQATPLTLMGLRPARYPYVGGIDALGIATGPDGALWFATFSASIGRITTSASPVKPVMRL